MNKERVQRKLGTPSTEVALSIMLRIVEGQIRHFGRVV